MKIVHLNALDKKEPFDQYRLDLGLGVVFDKKPETLISELLFTDASACVAYAKNSIMQKKLTMKDYLKAKHMVVIFPDEPYRSCIDKKLDQLGLKRNAVISVPHMIPAIYALTGTPYIVTTTQLIAETVGKSLKLAIQEPPFVTGLVKVEMAWSMQFTDNPRHQWLRNLMKQAAEKLK